MLKKGAHVPTARYFITQFLISALLCQPVASLGKTAPGQRDAGHRLDRRIVRTDVPAEGGTFGTGGAAAERTPAGHTPDGASQDDSCPAATSRPGATRLIYTGQVRRHCDAPLPVSARLTDACGNALADRRLNFTVGAQSASATTDANGVASASLATPVATTPLPLAVNFAGDENYSSAQDSASVQTVRADTLLRYTGPALLAAGAPETVRATLINATTGRPVPNAALQFEVGAARVSATTDAGGVATASLNLPASETFERSQLKVNFAGDECHNPASATAEVGAYLRTAFVVWGGNNERLRLGQRVNFWGHSWARQVTSGDYKAHGDFKGYADTVRQFQLCQVNVRTTGTPPLNNSCWSTKPGQSFPPPTLPEHIGVIVTTSADKGGAPDFGNIAALVVVKVDPEPRYGDTPGKPGFGAIVAVIADGEGIFGGSPSLAASQTQPAAVLPAQSFGVDLTVTNNSATAAANVLINESFTNLAPPNASDAVGALPPLSSQARRFGATTPALQARREGESSQDYQKRLGAADGTVYSSLGLVSFHDATGRAFPPVIVSSSSTLQLPRLAVGISAPSCVRPGEVIPYAIKLTNTGSAVAANASAVVTFADGTTARVETTNLEPGDVFSTTVNWKVPVIATKGAAESDADYISRLTSFDGKALKTTAAATWKDARGNTYGEIEQECSSVERVPILSQTAQAPPPMLPGQRVSLPTAVRNTGSAGALQARLRATNPDTSVFDAAPFNLTAGNSSDVPTALTAPPLAPREVGETDEAYRARLQSADNRPIDFAIALEWADAAGNNYGPVVGTLRTTEVLPIVLLSLSAPETVEAGDTITYQVTAENVGHADAAGVNLIVTLPDGQARPVTLPAGAIPPGDRQSSVVDFAVPDTQPEGQLNAQATVNWRDAAANGYGPTSASAATNVLNPNRPPVVNAGPDQTAVTPARVNLHGAASDDGKPTGAALTVLWTKVSGPGAVAFDNAGQAVTTATFGAEGTYVLRLTASDSVLGASDEATVVVTPAPTGPTYSQTADLTKGEGVSVTPDESNHLHLNNEATPFNFIWVAVSSKGTVVKIDTDTGQVLGEYFSSPAGQPKDPSRTTVDHNGNVWASNRGGNSVLRIALVENGQCVDRNGNGVIDTSRAQGDIRPWPNTGGADTDGGVETAQDECVINYTRVRAHGTRHVSVNAANDVWVSGTGGRQFDLLDGVTGQIKRQEPSVGYGGYGGLIDRKGVIWSARSLLRWDTALPLKGANGGAWKGYGHDSYGLCIDSQGNVWNTSYAGNTIRKFAPDGTLLGAFEHGGNSAQGCVVDMKDNVWVAHALSGRTVGRLKGDGTFIGNVTVGSGPTGVAVDAKGKIWATNHSSRNVSRIDPDLGPIGADGETRVGQVDLTTVDLKGNLYNYSDMTGSTLSGAPAGGTWTQVFDSGITGAEWGVIGWNGRVCGDSSLLVRVSSGSDGLNFSAPVAASNGAGFSVPAGRYLKVSVAFKRASSGESPFLHNLTVGTVGYQLPADENLPPSVDAGPDQTATMPNAANLVGSACDAGRIAGLAVSWSKVSGPGAVTFGNAQAPATPATFSEAGEYTLRLTAADANLSADDEMTVLVLPFNDPPAVNAGADQSVILPAAAGLAGAVTDDALPQNSSVAVSWSKLSGPGEVTFANGASAVTAAAFSEPGDYVLRLTGHDSQLANVDELAIKVYPPNKAPAVNAGDDRATRLPDKATLDAAVTDDGLPLGKTVTVAWSKVSGPGAVSFAKASAAATTAAFSLPGAYVLRLTASDSQLSASDELTVVVNPANKPPSVSAGADQAITLPNVANLAGTIADDDLPEGRAVTAAWSKVSGPGVVNFGSPDGPTTTASFSEAGTYVLRLTASDSALSRTDDVNVAVNPSPVNLPPNANAGPDHTITLPARATLSGAASDDRQPAGSTLTVAWSKVSGAGNVTFGNAAAAATTATFSAAGQYVLRLTAGDTEHTTADDIAVTVLPVNQPPVVRAGTDQLISFPASANLRGTATDDGLPSGGSLTVAWSQVSGPGEVSFADARAVATAATFSTGGKYVLRLTAGDSALSRSDDIAVTVNQAPTVNAGADQSLHLPGPASLAGRVTDDALPSGKAIAVAWTKVSGPGAVTFSKPSATSTAATFDEVGAYVLRLTANDSLLEDSDEIGVTVNPPLPPPPSIAIVGLADGAEITSRVDIAGSVSNGSWRLEYSLGPDVVAPGGGAWTTISAGDAPVTNAVLGAFDPTLLLNGVYAIRLSATDAAGQTSSVTRTAVVSGQQKVGNFSVSFEDLELPVGGLPIQLIRTYDSRDKRVGDFGVGWNLSVRNVRLEKSVELGRHWREVVVPGTIPQYCLQPTRPNVVTITFPGNRVYRFMATTAKQCQAASPIQFARFGFTPLPGTRGSLLPEAPLDVTVEGSFPGPVELLDSADPRLRTYDPTVFRFTDERGNVYIIDQKLGVRSIADPNGNRLTVNRDGITHSSGKSISFVRDQQGRITRLTDPLGNALTYAYDANGDLAAFRDAENNEVRFSYNDTHGLLDILDPRGVRAIRNEYDDRGRLLSHTDASGKKVTFTRDLNARQEVVTDRLGNVTLYEYDARGMVVRVTDAEGGVTRYTHDARDNKLSETNAVGKTTTFAYDAADNLVRMTDPLGNSTTYTYNSRKQPLTLADTRGVILTHTYDAKGNLTSQKDALGNLTSYTYSAGGLMSSRTDASGAVTRYEYDRSGNLANEVNAAGQATAYTYDANGNRLSQTASRSTPSGVETLTTSFQYDKSNRLVRTVDPDGGATRTEYNSLGQPAAAVDQLGRRASYEYDAMGQLVKGTNPDGSTEEKTYDAEGRVKTSKDRAGRVTSFGHDNLGRVVSTTQPDGSTIAFTIDLIGRTVALTDERGNTTRYEYDPNCGCHDRRTKVTDALGNVSTFAYNTHGNQVAMTDSNNRTTRYEYDALNRRTRVVYADSTSAATGYNALGAVAAKTDQAGKTERFEYDRLGRLIRVTDAAGGATAYGYDEQGNKISQTDALNRTTGYEYDKLGRRTKRTLPLGMSEAYAYDAAGNLVSRTDFNGRTTSYGYDAMNRLLRKAPDPTTGEPAVSFSYTATGRRAAMTDATGTTSYGYDSRDRLTSKATPQGTLAYTYDRAGNLLSTRSSNLDGVSVDYTYDPLNRLSTVTDNTPAGGSRPGTGTTSYSYDAAGNQTGYKYANGVSTAFTFDSLNRLTQVSAGKLTTLAGYAYTLGAAGNRLSLTESSGRRADYSYDDLYRLTKESVAGDPAAPSNGVISYGYDAVGNRLTRASTIAAVPSAAGAYDANDRPTGDAFDANGNVTRAGGDSYGYDSENRLTVLNPGTPGEVRVVYDGDGNRVARTAGGLTTKYLVDTNNPTGHAQVVEEIRTRAGRPAAVWRAYTYGHQLISQTQLIGGDWTPSFYGYDGQGSVRFLTDASGAVTDTYVFDAFGLLVSRTGATPNEHLYTGEQFDASLGLYFLRARYMSPSTGRFWSMDPYEGESFDPLSLHKYLYVYANPVNRTDPSGLQSLAEAKVVMANIATLTRMTLNILQAIERVNNVVDAINVVTGILRLASGAVPLDFLWDAMERALEGFSIRRAVQSLHNNLWKVLKEAYVPWVAWLIIWGRHVRGFYLLLPNVGLLRQAERPFRTGLPPLAGRWPVYLVMGGRSRPGHLTGTGFIQGGIPNIHQTVLVWRMDFHRWDRPRGPGINISHPDEELSVFIDHPFHYHVMRPRP